MGKYFPFPASCNVVDFLSSGTSQSVGMPLKVCGLIPRFHGDGTAFVVSQDYGDSAVS